MLRILCRMHFFKNIQGVLFKMRKLCALPIQPEVTVRRLNSENLRTVRPYNPPQFHNNVLFYKDVTTWVVISLSPGI